MTRSIHAYFASIPTLSFGAKQRKKDSVDVVCELAANRQKTGRHTGVAVTDQGKLFVAKGPAIYNLFRKCVDRGWRMFVKSKDDKDCWIQ